MALCFALSPMKAFAASDGKVSVEDEYVYFVVQEGEVTEISSDEYSELVGGQRSNKTRATGSWSINSSLIEAGKAMYYFQGNGEDFKVAAGEYIELEINRELHSRTFGVGYTGTSELEEEISIPIFKGARVAFIDALVTPGEYRVLIRNMGEKTEVINGHIYIY